MNSLPVNFNELRKQFERSKNVATAIAILDAYFTCYKPDDFHEELWLLRSMLTVKGDFPVNALQKENLIFFIDATMLAMQVVHWVYTSESCPGLDPA